MMPDDVLTLESAIERRYGPSAAAEWQVMLNRLDLGEGFVLIVLVVPDRDGAAVCRLALERWLAERGQRLTAFEPDEPKELHDAASTLFGLAEDPDRGAIWLAAVAAPGAKNEETWDLAWRHALLGLNQDRNALRRRFSLPLILVGSTALVAAMREIASDLWSVRALSLRIEPGPDAVRRVAEIDGRDGLDKAATGHDRADPDLALRMADRVRQREGLSRTVADLLDRAAKGFAARGQRIEAERAGRRAAEVYEACGAGEPAGAAWVEVGDAAMATGRTLIGCDAYAKALRIRQALVLAAPARADYQHDLSVSSAKTAEAHLAMGWADAARHAFEDALRILIKLARDEPGRDDYHHDLSLLYTRMGDVWRTLDRPVPAGAAYARAVRIAEALAHKEPGRADFQRALAVAYGKQGDAYLWVGRHHAAREAHAMALAIAETFVRTDPGRADYQRDLSFALRRIGDSYRSLGQMDAEQRAIAEALAIMERLASAEPDRADYQCDLIVCLVRQAGLEAGDTQQACVILARAYDIAVTLQQQGKLPPRDAWMTADLRKRLQQARASIANSTPEPPT